MSKEILSNNKVVVFITVITTIGAIIGIVLAIYEFPKITIAIVVIPFFVFLLYRIINRLISKCSKKTFDKRDESTPLMKKDLKKYKHLAFIGVSHKNLHTYLEEVITSNKEKPLPWKSIMIFYATPELGNMWEPKVFEDNIKQSKLNIVSTLFDEKHKKIVPDLDTIQFRQCKSTSNFSSFSGCFLGNDSDNKDINLEVIYSVIHLPIDNQTENSWTIRIKKRYKPEADPLFNMFKESFIKVKNGAEIICNIKFSVWEWSSNKWDTYVKDYSHFNEGIDYMLEGLNMNNKHILDVGAGTGNVANYLIEKFPHAKVTLVDKAANMLIKAKGLIGDKSDYELFPFPLEDSDYFIRNNRNKYDYIISHLSLQSLINNLENLSSFVSNCNNLLQINGSIILAIHNSHDIPFERQSSSNQNDSFRQGLLNEIENNGLKTKDTSSSPFRIEDIRSFFTKQYFEEKFFKEHELPFTMLDRKRLWEVPAVLDSLVDVKTIGINKGITMVQKAWEKNLTFSTPKMKIIVYHFQKK
jgi:SAM-dependent methyltransferase